METKDILTLAGLAVSLGGLILSLAKLAHEQRKANDFKQNAEIRTEYKLRIYQALIDERLKVDELTSRIQDHSPTSSINPVELRKCIYEMLVEDTLVAYEDKTYSSNTMDGWDENEEDDEDDEVEEK